MQPIFPRYGVRTSSGKFARHFVLKPQTFSCAVIQVAALCACCMALGFLLTLLVTDMLVYVQKKHVYDARSASAQFDSSSILRELDRHEDELTDVRRSLAEYRITSEARMSRMEERFSTLEWVAKGIAAGVGGLILMELGKAYSRMQRRRTNAQEDQ